MNENTESKDFIRSIIEEDLKFGKNGGRVHTRFPPEPNGYLHIGHAKSIVLNFGVAEEYNGLCNLRFDDTNPVKEDVEYVDSIKQDIKWLGFDWENREYFASDYFDQLYDMAVGLINKGLAYVDSSSPETISAERGEPTKPGIESKYRNRSVDENLDLFDRMRKGEFDDGTHVLRAKIDMSSPNMNMRDPILYRIKHAFHHRTGNKWCIYPMYDYAHGQSDAIEGITHSLCTLEFENHRPLYNWFIENLDVPSQPRQIEFARLNLNFTVMSKRKLNELVLKGIVDAWDDPRMPTLSGLRRRGYTPASIRIFAESVGIAKRDNIIDIARLEYAIREDLNKNAERVFAVLDPLEIEITNYPDDKTEMLPAPRNHENHEIGNREIQFCKYLYIEREDFMEEPPKKFFRLSPGAEVRLKYAYIIRCDEVIKDETGKVIKLLCSYDPETKSGVGTSTKKVKAAIHWVSKNHCFESEVRLYDRLFEVENPLSEKEGKTYLDYINPNSLEIKENCKLELNAKKIKLGENFQFERLGYFCLDYKYSTEEKFVFNRTVTLKDSWVKEQKKN